MSLPCGSSGGWLAGVLVCVMAAALTAQEKSPHKLHDAAQTAAQADIVDRLVRRLADDDYRVREKATEALAELSADAQPILRQHLETARVAEVQFRLRRVLGENADVRPVAPQLCVSDYFVAVCDGDEAAARRCLSPAALDEIDMQGTPLHAPVVGFTSFKVIDAVLKDESTAHVRSEWQTRSKQGARDTQIFVSILKRTQAGWRISATMDGDEFARQCAL